MQNKIKMPQMGNGMNEVLMKHVVKQPKYKKPQKQQRQDYLHYQN